LAKVIPDLVWDKALPFPMNNSWGYHDAATGNGRYDLYYKEMVERYGEPASMKEFSDKMQLMNASGYQGIFEAAGHRLNDIGGVMLWKLNAAFPSVIWQVYDWFLIPNAGYYFMQNACEPVHIQLNVKDLNVEYINRSHHPVKSLTASIEVFDTASVSLFRHSEAIDLSSSEARESLSIADAVDSNKGVSFVVLNLTDLKGKIVSHNVYWISADNNFRSLNDLQATSIFVKVIEASTGNDNNRWKIKLSNNTDRIAFFINPQLISEGGEVAPSFWSANYFTLAPKESVTVTVECPGAAISGGATVLKVEGWNIQDTVIPLTTAKLP
jgi:hypothetical protein